MVSSRPFMYYRSERRDINTLFHLNFSLFWMLRIWVNKIHRISLEQRMDHKLMCLLVFLVESLTFREQGAFPPSDITLYGTESSESNNPVFVWSVYLIISLHNQLKQFLHICAAIYLRVQLCGHRIFLSLRKPCKNLFKNINY